MQTTKNQQHEFIQTGSDSQTRLLGAVGRKKGLMALCSRLQHGVWMHGSIFREVSEIMEEAALIEYRIS